ncbi:TetR/AcrR family transcriptional regulator [Amycolatopsis sp. SID8362]|uniref:TetR/AcrR family transcriptional regulator n=1 Tax=Amycolatopsis sp. SID8362 TaxID=2690346 RepID=UPI0013721772|nr:TetR/AcrR family transcriptional regulator [Amycolatopsis sp. SID8362]NBH09902.1 TetR family transcriptional regulator [Amycolatopsis sp. SID8362]NED46595.1 TetR family transcriptional regulator [Amycolatopsis sp. SID8362]
MTAKERLVEAAFALFAERGYDQTTIDDITERAGVGRTTFFRTFRAKEDVIFPDHEVLLQAIEARLAGSTERTALLAVTEGTRLVLRHYLAEGELARTRYQLTRSVPVLRDREISGLQQYQRLFRGFLHRWMGGGEDTALRAELMAGAVVTAHNHVLRRWLRGRSSDPEREFDAAMAETVALFTRPEDDGEASIVVFRTTKDLATVLPELNRVLGEGLSPA